MTGKSSGEGAECVLKGDCKTNRKERKERKDLRKTRLFFAISAFFAVNDCRTETGYIRNISAAGFVNSLRVGR
jgi:hypothetical protein